MESRRKKRFLDDKIKYKIKSKDKEKKKYNTKARRLAGEDFPYEVNISVGADQSTGPGFYSVTIVKSTLSQDELVKAYKAGVLKLGFDLQKEICTNNSNCALSTEHFKKLAANGIPVLDDGGEEENDLDFELTLESYRDIWLHICRLGNPHLNWVVGDFAALPIGGNGLFQDLIEQRDKQTDPSVTSTETKA